MSAVCRVNTIRIFICRLKIHHRCLQVNVTVTVLSQLSRLELLKHHRLKFDCFHIRDDWGEKNHQLKIMRCTKMKSSWGESQWLLTRICLLPILPPSIQHTQGDSILHVLCLDCSVFWLCGLDKGSLYSLGLILSFKIVCSMIGCSAVIMPFIFYQY